MLRNRKNLSSTPLESHSDILMIGGFSKQRAASLKFKTKKNTLTGFTLIELLVSITIALLLMATGAFIISGQKGMGQVTSDAELLGTFIGRARNLAANPDDINATGYGVREVTAATNNLPTELELFKKVNGSSNQIGLGEKIKLTGSRIGEVGVASSFLVLFSTPSGTYNGELQKPLYLIRQPGTKKIITVKAPGYVDVR